VGSAFLSNDNFEEIIDMAKAAVKAKAPAAKAAATKAKAKAPAAKAKAAPAKAKAAPAPKPVFKLVDKPIIALTDIIKVMAERHAMPKATVKTLFSELFSEVALALKAGRKVRLSGFGIGQVRERAARMGRNPATGAAIKIKASKRVAFRIAKDFKDSVL
jgi:DNA-binding protein HU-beta